MGISVEKVGVQPADEQKTSSATHVPEKIEQEESIFVKAKEKNNSWTTANTISLIGGIILGFAAIRFMPQIVKAIKNRTANKNLSKTLENMIKKGEGHTVSLSELKKAEEKAFYESILKDFDDAFPAKPPKFDFGKAKSLDKTHINGFKSQRVYLEGKPTSYTYDNGISSITILTDSNHCYSSRVGNDTLLNEFKAYLNGRQPNGENFLEFIRHKDISYVKENWQTLYSRNFSKEAEKQLMDEAIKDSEELYRRRMKGDLKRLWRPYPTDKFYRIVDKNELMKMLHGEEIISTGHVRGYDRIDISTNPYYDRISRLGKFRISFKQANYNGTGNTSLASRISLLKEEYQHYQIHGSYNINDVKLDEIKAWNGDEWIPVRIVSKEG